MRKVLVIGVLLELAIVAIGLTWIAPFEGDGSGTVVEVNLTAMETTQSLADGVDYQVWTFNGTAPGPAIRVKVGDTVRFTLTNDSSLGLSHSMDFHAAQTPWDKNYP